MTQTLNKTLKTLAIAGTCLLFISCASLPKLESDNFQKLTERNIDEINGLYSNFPEKPEKHLHLSFSGRLTFSKLKDSITKVEIEVINNKDIRFTFINNYTVIDSKTVKYKLKDDGFLQLRNNNFKIHGIPYIFGDYKICKYNIGRSGSGNLIMNGVEKREGAHLIILWSPTKNYKFTDVYKKIL